MFRFQTRAAGPREAGQKLEVESGYRHTEEQGTTEEVVPDTDMSVTGFGDRPFSGSLGKCTEFKGRRI